MASDNKDRDIGKLIKDKWRIDARLGEGGTAIVYAATHRNGGKVAIKVLRPEIARTSDFKVRFLREGYAANAIKHRGVVRVLDDDVMDDGSVFLVMDMLEGESLSVRAAARGGAIPLEEMLPIADKLLEILTAAHAQHIVHRDIKPDNVFLTHDGDLRVLDFGLARMKPLVEAFKLEATGTGVVLGTLDYMSPEQARAENTEVDERSDLWAVGATIYTMLSGRRVHSGKMMHEYLVATANETPRSLAVMAPHVPAEVVAVVDRALALAKDHRWSTAREMQQALRAAHPSAALALTPF